VNVAMETHTKHHHTFNLMLTFLNEYMYSRWLLCMFWSLFVNENLHCKH